jgi:hypothetical protein
MEQKRRREKCFTSLHDMGVAIPEDPLVLVSTTVSAVLDVVEGSPGNGRNRTSHLIRMDISNIPSYQRNITLVQGKRAAKVFISSSLLIREYAVRHENTQLKYSKRHPPQVPKQ